LLELFAGTIVPRPSFFRVHYEVLRGEQTVGKLFEKSILSLNRSITIDVSKDIDVPVQFFFLFLVYNRAFR
jgi:hypothetical protein